MFGYVSLVVVFVVFGTNTSISILDKLEPIFVNLIVQ